MSHSTNCVLRHIRSVFGWASNGERKNEKKNTVCEWKFLGGKTIIIVVTTQMEMMSRFE